MLTALAQIFWLLVLGLIPAVLLLGAVATVIPTLLLGYALVKRPAPAPTNDQHR